MRKEAVSGMDKRENSAAMRRREPITDTQLLMTITICIFVCMYVLAILIWGGGFKKPQGKHQSPAAAA